MATQYAFGKIVTSGLVLSLNAADRNSYPGSGTTWTDMSGNGNNGTLTNGPTFSSANGGSIVFDGVDDRVSRSEALNTGQNFTVSAWIYPTLLGTTQRAIVGNSYNYTGRNGWLFSTAGGTVNNTLFLSIGADQSYVISSTNSLSPNVWQYVTGVVTNGGSAISLYLNNSVLNTPLPVLSSGTITYTHPQFNIGFRDVGGATTPYTGNISSVQIYNRALSAQEILQNYNAQKSRFGL